MNWKGIYVKPISSVFQQLQKNRDSIKIEGCDYSNEDHVKFILCIGYTEMLSGVVNDYVPKHLNRINYEKSIHNGSVDEILIKAYKMSNVFEQNNIKTIYYLSIDVVGSEYQVLLGIYFDKVYINIMTIEDNYPGRETSISIDKLLTKNNFYKDFVVCGDNVYVNKNLKYSWEN